MSKKDKSKISKKKLCSSAWKPKRTILLGFNATVFAIPGRVGANKKKQKKKTKWESTINSNGFVVA